MALTNNSTGLDQISRKSFHSDFPVWSQISGKYYWNFQGCKNLLAIVSSPTHAEQGTIAQHEPGGTVRRGPPFSMAAAVRDDPGRFRYLQDERYAAAHTAPTAGRHRTRNSIWRDLGTSVRYRDRARYNDRRRLSVTLQTWY